MDNEQEITSTKQEESLQPTVEESFVEAENLSDDNGDVQADEAPETKGEKAKRIVKKYCKRYFIDAFTGMAQGLFCTLIAGTIVWQIGDWIGKDVPFGLFLITLGNLAKMLMGAGIGVGIAHKLGAKPLVIFSAAVAGLIGAWASVNSATNAGLIQILLGKGTLSVALGAPGNPIGSYVVSLFAVEIASLYAGKTKLDIVLVPLGMILMSLVSIWIAWPFIRLVDYIGIGIALAIQAGTAVKIIVGIFVAVVMGVLLTMPTSSAAIWIAIAAAIPEEYAEALAIAGGAAVAGCAAHMVGFAVASFRENKWSGLISQGIGTSMLQIPNIMKHPIIIVPEIIASAVSGLVAVLLGLRCDATGGGMGTSGLVGVMGTVRASLSADLETWKLVLGIILCLFVIPAVVSFGFSELFRKLNLIKLGDQKLD
ncbi:MAG: PTS sugar transporter subunit IIC [Clostridia bacterium]|nr:PTS sugar transporter subunit IIC [Clostridia bacterium]